jgi:type VI protein secretion system component Hcp
MITPVPAGKDFFLAYIEELWFKKRNLSIRVRQRCILQQNFYIIKFTNILISMSCSDIPHQEVPWPERAVQA